MTNRRHRRSNKKKHDAPLTEDMLNELNKNSMGVYGGGHHQGMGHPAGGMAYDNYGQDPDEFYDLDDVWNNDRYNFGQNRYKVIRHFIQPQNGLFINISLVMIGCRDSPT